MSDAAPVGFRLTLTAQAEDIDELGHVNNAVWVQWIQQVATAHWYAAADPAVHAAHFWVVVRHEIDYRRPLLEGDTVFGETWIDPQFSGAKSTRHVRFVDAAGRVYVTARTEWAMLSRSNGRPQRVTQEIVAPLLRAID